METVIHARSEPQSDIAAVAVSFDQIEIAEQIVERIGKTLGLIKLGAGDRAAGADDRVTRADKDIHPPIDRTRAILELAGETIVHAAELCRLRLPQVEV